MTDDEQGLGPTSYVNIKPSTLTQNPYIPNTFKYLGINECLSVIIIENELVESWQWGYFCNGRILKDSQCLMRVDITDTVLNFQ